MWKGIDTMFPTKGEQLLRKRGLGKRRGESSQQTVTPDDLREQNDHVYLENIHSLENSINLF